MANSSFTKGSLATPVSVPNGGTGLATVTSNKLVKGNGTSALTVTGIDIDSSDNISGYGGVINPQTGTTYTLVSGDKGKIVELSNASSITLTLPNSLPVGWCCTVAQTGAGQVSLSAASGATLRNRSSFTKIAGQYGMITLYVTTNSGGAAAVYMMAGDGST